MLASIRRAGLVASAVAATAVGQVPVAAVTPIRPNYPAWPGQIVISPDGRFTIASSDSGLIQFDRTSGRWAKIANSPSRLLGARWSPDGRSIYMARMRPPGRSRDTRIVRFNFASGTLDTLRSGGERFLGLSSDGRYLAEAILGPPRNRIAISLASDGTPGALRVSRGAQLVLDPVPAEIPQLQGDAEALEQVFVNLLINAAHALPSGGSTQVCVARDGENVAVTVSDDGAGTGDRERAGDWDDGAGGASGSRQFIHRNSVELTLSVTRETNYSTTSRRELYRECYREWPLL